MAAALASLCKPAQRRAADDLMSLVRSYRMHNRPGSLEELKFFRNMPSLDVAIHHAGLSINQREKRFSHQCRIPFAALRHAKALLTSNATRLKACDSFHDLHTLLSRTLERVRDLGELYVYDTAIRLGSFLGLETDRVYLHAGTRAGARALGLDVSAAFLEVTAFPEPIQSLAPHEIEDFLCIYKTRLSG